MTRRQHNTGARWRFIGGIQSFGGGGLWILPVGSDDRLQPGGAVPGDRFGGGTHQCGFRTDEVGVVKRPDGPDLGGDRAVGSGAFFHQRCGGGIVAGLEQQRRILGTIVDRPLIDKFKIALPQVSATSLEPAATVGGIPTNRKRESTGFNSISDASAQQKSPKGDLLVNEERLIDGGPNGSDMRAAICSKSTRLNRAFRGASQTLS